MRKNSIIFVAIIAAFILVVSVYGKDTEVIWSPETVDVTVEQGKDISVDVSFISAKSINKAVVIIDPSLKGYTTVTSNDLSRVGKNTPVRFTLTFSVSTTTSIGTYTGGITLTKDVPPEKVYGTLPVTLHVIEPRIEAEGVSFELPGEEWHVDEKQQELGGAVELMNFTQWGHGGILPVGGASVSMPVVPLDRPIQEIINEHTKEDLIQSTSQIIVGGENAIRVESTAFPDKPFAENEIGVYLSHNGKLYRFILNYRPGDPHAEDFIQAFNHVLNTVTFN